MGTFGDKLRRERELRGISLDEIAEATKIGTRSLRALEDEKFDLLPGGIFNKGFVRAYAKFLGLDEEQAVADYVTATGEQQAQSKADVLERMAEQAEAARSNQAAANGSFQSARSNGIWIAVAILALIGAGGAGGWRLYLQKLQKNQDSQTVAAAPVQAPVSQAVVTPTPAQTDPNAAAMQTQPSAAAPLQAANSQYTVPGQNQPSSSAVQSPAASQNPTDASSTMTKSADSGEAKPALELKIKVSEPTWVSVKADGKPASTETLKDSVTKTVLASDRIVLTTGKAVEITCNGKSLGRVGNPEKRSQTTFGPDCKMN